MSLTFILSWTKAQTNTVKCCLVPYNISLCVRCLDRMTWGAPNGGHSSLVKAGGAGGGRIHLRLNYRDKRLLNTLQGAVGRTAKERLSVTGGGEDPQFQGRGREYGEVWKFPFFW